MEKPYQSIQDQVYDTLRSCILNINLVPGTIMSTQEIATRLQVSRTPVREAFIRLQRDGLVQILPQRETMVSLIDMDRVRQERFLRMNLEQAAIRLFVRHMEPEHLHRLHSLIEKQLLSSVHANYEELHQYDNEFHSVFFVGANQPLVWNLINQSSTHYQRIRLLSLRHQTISGDIVFQHQEILRALENRQLDTLLAIHQEHLSKLDGEERIFREKNPEYFLEVSSQQGLL